MAYRYNIPQDKARDLYLREGRSIRMIAALYGVSEGTVRNRLKEMGVPLRSMGDALMLAWRKGRRFKRSTAITVNCNFCGKEIKKDPSKIKRDERHFCNRGCKSGFYHKVKVRYKIRVDRRNIELRQKIKQMRLENPFATLREMGNKCGVSRERVRQILKEE